MKNEMLEELNGEVNLDALMITRNQFAAILSADMTSPPLDIIVVRDVECVLIFAWLPIFLLVLVVNSQILS